MNDYERERESERQEELLRAQEAVEVVRSERDEAREEVKALAGALRAVLAHGVTHEVGCSHRDETCSCCRGRAVKALEKVEVGR